MRSALASRKIIAVILPSTTAVAVLVLLLVLLLYSLYVTVSVEARGGGNKERAVFRLNFESRCWNKYHTKTRTVYTQVGDSSIINGTAVVGLRCSQAVPTR